MWWRLLLFILGTMGLLLLTRVELVPAIAGKVEAAVGLTALAGIILRSRRHPLEPQHLPQKNGHLVVELLLRPMQQGDNSKAGSRVTSSAKYRLDAGWTVRFSENCPCRKFVVHFSPVRVIIIRAVLPVL
jgi:hypothetical protein